MTKEPGIYDANNHSYADILTLCEEENFFYSFENDDSQEKLEIAAGGVFKLTKPGTLMQPVYFAFPAWGEAFWFQLGPDMGINYGHNWNYVDYCTNGRKDITENYSTFSNDFVTNGSDIQGISINSAKDKIITTDGNLIQNYWKDNVITVGFRGDPLNNVKGYISEFYASGSSTPCLLQSHPDYNPNYSTPICTFSVSASGQYDFEKDMISINSGEKILIRVIAKFQNGESIEECRSITLSSTYSTYNNIAVQIRGNINNYSSTSQSYLIEIYKTQP